jgi:hypothetical protein
MPSSPPISRQKKQRHASHLLLTIDETLYAVRPLACEPTAAHRAFRLQKLDGTFYNVAQTEVGSLCDCPDFIFRREGIDPAGCKHVQGLVAQGMIEPRA